MSFLEQWDGRRVLNRGGGLREVGQEQILLTSCRGKAAAGDPVDGTRGPVGKAFMVAP